MYELKPLSKQAIGGALEKAERYRVLNEPEEAESICRDVLEIDPENQEALCTLLLAMTDQFGRRMFDSFQPALEILPRLTDEHDRAYYEGIIYERRAKAHLGEPTTEGQLQAYDFFQQALACFERAEKVRPAGNDNALLRWNSCVRSIQKHRLKGRPPEPADFRLE